MRWPHIISGKRSSKRQKDLLILLVPQTASSTFAYQLDTPTWRPFKSHAHQYNSHKHDYLSNKNTDSPTFWPNNIEPSYYIVSHRSIGFQVRRQQSVSGHNSNLKCNGQSVLLVRWLHSSYLAERRSILVGFFFQHRKPKLAIPFRPSFATPT